MSWTSRRLASSSLAHACRDYIKHSQVYASCRASTVVPAAVAGAVTGGYRRGPAAQPYQAQKGSHMTVRSIHVSCAMVNAASTNGRVKYLFDGGCKVCQTFKSSLQSQEANRDRINYIDIADKSFNPSDHNNVSYDDAMSTIHAITPEGKTLKGPDAVRELFGEAGAVTSFLAEASKQPGFDQLFGSAYDWLSHHRFEISDVAQKAQKSVGAE